MPGPREQAKVSRPQGTGANRRMKQLGQGLLFTLLLYINSPGQAEDRQTSEYNIKAAFLYNFSSFINWPEQSPRHNDEFELCVVGNDPFGKALDTISGKSVHGSLLTIRRLSSAETSDTCKLIYISKSEAGRYALLLSQIQARPVLTVSDIEEFAVNGGIIRFKLVGNKIRFEINVDAAERAGLKVSSRLLSLATIVREDRLTAR